MFGNSHPPYKDASRGTRGLQQAFQDKPSRIPRPDTTMTYRTTAEQDSVPLSSTSSTAQTYPQTPFLKTSRFVKARSGIPAPVKLTTDTHAKAEFTRLPTHPRPLDSGVTRQSIKEKFIKSVLSTQMGQTISDNLAPYVERSAICSFPGDDAFHSRDEYIRSTLHLWDRMKVNPNSSSELASTIQPDQMPSWTHANVITPRLPTDKKEGVMNPARPDVTLSCSQLPTRIKSMQSKMPRLQVAQSHPSILRPGPKRPIQESQYRPPVPPKERVNYSIPIRLSPKIGTYDGKHDIQKPAPASSTEKVDYRVPIHQPSKAQTYPGKEDRQDPVPRQQSSHTAVVDKGPDREWRTSSFGAVKYWSGHDPRANGLLLKAAPVVDLTRAEEKYPSNNMQSKEKARSNRQQHVFGSYSKDDAKEYKRDSDIYKSANPPKQAQTYPQDVARREPLPNVLHPSSSNVQVTNPQNVPIVSQIPRLVIKRKPVAPRTPAVTSMDKNSTTPPQLPRRTESEQHPSTNHLMGLEPSVEKKSRVKLTAEQRQLAFEMLNRSNTESSYITDRNSRPPSAPRPANRRLPEAQIPLNPQASIYIREERLIAQAPLNPQAKTYVRQEIPVDNSSTSAPGQKFVRDRYRPSPILNDHSSGLNPIAKTYHQKQYY